ncbi:uncharacterized protein TRAVEDRAFT_42858 [Trametes versicolor FP-101664 SS1]|uniref:uncharacterized protein n=1 Tax=Trametes versicolor (strain FP-101664) TaxID=717944 RepID=UPI0004623BD4|nr:uncharacterized protein TRAVEDRAFT_42858 [Trametes versicolor FP-101664 SS1]EIW62499.1 hypothetical protein TRAVEDRAFT_42858 [Trametes versicolor FP-101664 SS1]
MSDLKMLEDPAFAEPVIDLIHHPLLGFAVRGCRSEQRRRIDSAAPGTDVFIEPRRRSNIDTQDQLIASFEHSVFGGLLLRRTEAVQHSPILGWLPGGPR